MYASYHASVCMTANAVRILQRSHSCDMHVVMLLL